MGKRRIFMVLVPAAALVAMVGTATPAAAITNGQPDGNGHPNVGIMVASTPDGFRFHLCTGSLIASNEFLTAAHCLSFLPGSGIILEGVSFDPVYDPTTVSIVPAASFTVDPQFTGKDFGDIHDLGVITLAATVSTPPVKLPTAGLLDQLAAQGGLRGQQFTNVGYGVTGINFGGGRPQPNAGLEDPAVRRVSMSPFMSSTPTILKLLENTSATGEGGTCAFDSGSPRFLTVAGQQVDVAVSSLGGDPVCKANAFSYRLDTPSARAFLGQFVALP